MEKLYEMQISLHNVLLEHRHAHLRTYYLWLLSPYNGKIE